MDGGVGSTEDDASNVSGNPTAETRFPPDTVTIKGSNAVEYAKVEVEDAPKGNCRITVKVYRVFGDIAFAAMVNTEGPENGKMRLPKTQFVGLVPLVVLPAAHFHKISGTKA